MRMVCCSTNGLGPEHLLNRDKELGHQLGSSVRQHLVGGSVSRDPCVNRSRFDQDGRDLAHRDARYRLREAVGHDRNEAVAGY